MNEPTITINGEPLSTGEAMTVRVAIESLAGTLSVKGLGQDEHGYRMVKAYLDNIEEIRRLMRLT